MPRRLSSPVIAPHQPATRPSRAQRRGRYHRAASASNCGRTSAHRPFLTRHGEHERKPFCLDSPPADFFPRLRTARTTAGVQLRRFSAHGLRRRTKGYADMAIKVGINGFGRIGRNVLRAALAHEGGLRLRRRQRPHRRQDARVSPQVRLGPRPARRQGRRRRRLAWWSTATASRSSQRARSRQAAVGRSRARRRPRVHRSLHRSATRRRRTSRRGAKKVLISAPGKEVD